MRSAGATDSRPDRPTIFIDRNSGGRSFKAILESKGIRVVLHDEEFARDVPDETWISEVGKRGWIAITGDNAITRSPLALHHLIRSKLFLFILHGLNGATREGKAECILASYEKMSELVQTAEPPKIWRIGKDGVARLFDFRKVLVRMQRR